jgi:NADH dehydrogenase
MRVLVTGPGRLGHALITELHRRGITGTVLHRSASDSLPPGWRSVRADVTRPESLAGVCTDCDQVLHLAAVTHSNRRGRYTEVNANGTRNLVVEAQRAGVQRFTLVSTRAISPAGGAYSRSKIQAEEIVRDSGLAWNILRPAEVYGAGGEGISTLIERCRQGRWIPVAGDGSALLAPVYVDDVIDGICRAVMTPSHGGVHVLAGPEEMSYRQLIERLRPFSTPVPAPSACLPACSRWPVERSRSCPSKSHRSTPTRWRACSVQRVTIPRARFEPLVSPPVRSSRDLTLSHARS